MKITIKSIAYNGILAALYVVLTLATYNISYLALQFRVAELLMLLCFFRKDSIIGVTIGCFIANLFSFSAWDLLFGTMATIIAGTIMMFSKHLAFAAFMPVLFNGFIVGFELWWLLGEPFWISVLSVSLGELAVMAVGYIFFMIMKRRKGFFEAMLLNQNLDFKF